MQPMLRVLDGLIRIKISIVELDAWLEHVEVERTMAAEQRHQRGGEAKEQEAVQDMHVIHRDSTVVSPRCPSVPSSRSPIETVEEDTMRSTPRDRTRTTGKGSMTTWTVPKLIYPSAHR